MWVCVCVFFCCRCKIPECDFEPIEYMPVWLSNAVPYNNNGMPAKCERYEFIKNATRPDDEPVHYCPSSSFNRSKLVKCNELLYETDDLITITKEVTIDCLY